ncbi:MAG: DUF3592 domain-containing protein [Acidobacteriia bacterium]|nr:DUF3592 domain-containing protein [Terriglobia bacterium]
MGLYVLVAMFVGVGVLFSWLGWNAIVSTRKKLASWLRVEGTVVGLEEQPDNRGRTLYAPVYRYTADGVHTATSSTASSPSRYKVGDPVRVVVNPVKADESEVIDATTAIFSYGLMAAGVVALAVGLLVLWLVVSGQVH